MTRVERAFYHGILAALAVVKDYDQATMFREIVNTVDEAKLIRAALDDEQMGISGLDKYGYGQKREAE